MDLHRQIHNIPTPPDRVDHAAQTAIDETDGIVAAAQRAYKYGHRDARHAACDLSNEAAQRIRELEASNAEMARVGDEMLEKLKQATARVAELEKQCGALEAERDEARETLEAATGYMPPCEIDGSD